MEPAHFTFKGRRYVMIKAEYVIHIFTEEEWRESASRERLLTYEKFRREAIKNKFGGVF